MDKICFLNNKEIKYNATIIRISSTVVKIIFDNNIPDDETLVSGFYIENKFNSKNMTGDYYYNYNTIYKKSEDTLEVMLSNDNSIYVEPEESIPEPEPEYTPTEEELKQMLETNKLSKIQNSKELLALYLETNPLLSNCHGGVDAYYSVTMEKQALMTSNYLTYTIAKQSGLEPQLTWNAMGQECEVWTEEEFITLVLQIATYVKPFVTMQQSYEVQIRDCETQEELNAIMIAY